MEVWKNQNNGKREKICPHLKEYCYRFNNFSHFYFVYISTLCISILAFKGFSLEAESLRFKSFLIRDSFLVWICLWEMLMVFKFEIASCLRVQYIYKYYKSTHLVNCQLINTNINTSFKSLICWMYWVWPVSSWLIYLYQKTQIQSVMIISKNPFQVHPVIQRVWMGFIARIKSTTMQILHSG